MPIRFQCPECESILECGESKAGQKSACPKCKQRLQVPLPSRAKPQRQKTVLGRIIDRGERANPKPATNPAGEQQSAGGIPRQKHRKALPSSRRSLVKIAATFAVTLAIVAVAASVAWVLKTSSPMVAIRGKNTTAGTELVPAPGKEDRARSETQRKQDVRTEDGNQEQTGAAKHRQTKSVSPPRATAPVAELLPPPTVELLTASVAELLPPPTVELTTEELIAQHAIAAHGDAETSLANLAKYLSKPCKTDRDKAWGIYCWITDRIAYDAESFFTRRYGDNSPKAVFESRKAVCAGYSALFADLGKRMELDVVQVVGRAKGIGHIPGTKVSNDNHAWIAVRLGGEWQLIDATWGAGQLDGKKKQFVKSFTDFYFLTAPDKLIFTHLPAKKEWQLLKEPLTVKQFEKQPQVDCLLFQMGVLPEAIRTAASQQSFRECPGCLRGCPSQLKLMKAPLSRHLTAGTEYDFEMELPGYGEILIYNEGVRTLLQKDGFRFHGKVQATKGKLMVAVRRSSQVPKYTGCIVYVVE